jgi:hypothetical protein
LGASEKVQITRRDYVIRRGRQSVFLSRYSGNWDLCWRSFCVFAAFCGSLCLTCRAALCQKIFYSKPGWLAWVVPISLKFHSSSRESPPSNGPHPAHAGLPRPLNHLAGGQSLTSYRLAAQPSPFVMRGIARGIARFLSL